MKKLVGLLTLLASTSAFAADMPVKAPYAPVAAPTGWGGFYLGLQGGENLGRFDPLNGNTAVNFNDNSFMFGGHAGYLFETRNNFVIGPEVGAQWLQWNKTVNVGTVLAPTPIEEKLNLIVYANLRAGVQIGNLLPYITGGAAWAHATGTVVGTNLGAIEPNIGWNIGAGVELKLGDNLFLGAEYRHYDFSRASPALGLTPADLTMDQALGRLSYRP